jgi:2,4-dienoyl-CoA reductase-like NADH-dependent reductase (Old Yellow Enzyme family)
MTASFSLFQLGPHALAHRVVMAPLTRMRSDPGEVPTPQMATCGSIANRARILLEITEAVSAVWGCGRVGVTLPPAGQYGSMSDSDPAATPILLTSKHRLDSSLIHLLLQLSEMPRRSRANPNSETYSR